MYPGPGQREKYPANVPRGWEWWKQRLTHTNRDHQIRNVGGVERVDSEGHKVPPNESLHIQTKLSSSSFVPLVLSRSDPFAAIIKKSGVLGFYFAPHWCLSSLCVLCSCEQVLCVDKQTGRQRQGERPPHSSFFLPPIAFVLLLATWDGTDPKTRHIESSCIKTLGFFHPNSPDPNCSVLKERKKEIKKASKQASKEEREDKVGWMNGKFGFYDEREHFSFLLVLSLAARLGNENENGLSSISCALRSLCACKVIPSHPPVASRNTHLNKCYITIHCT